MIRNPKIKNEIEQQYGKLLIKQTDFMGNQMYETGDEEMKQGYSDTGYDTDPRLRERVERIN
jgi:hypothetical protein